MSHDTIHHDPASGQGQTEKEARPAEAAATAGPVSGAAAPRAQAAPVRNRVPAQEPAPMNPYLAGVFLGLTLLASYLILGAGLGASGAFARLGAFLEHLALPARVGADTYFGAYFPNPLSYYLVFMVAGIFAGGLLSALTGGRVRFMIERGPTASRLVRLAFALAGGVLAGFASRLAMGCTSGQGLSGGALLFTGSFVFMAALFGAGYLAAWAFRRQWR